MVTVRISCAACGHQAEASLQTQELVDAWVEARKAEHEEGQLSAES